MLDYKRFISYLYAYVDGEKGVNVGYIRCDQRQGNCRLVLNLQDRQGIEGGKYKVYLYRVESEQSPVGYYLDEFCINKNCGELKKQTMSENVWNTNRGIGEFDGIIAIYDKTHIYASQWTDTPLDVRRFLTYADWQKQRKQSSETWEKSSIQALTPEAQPTQMPSQAQSQTLQEQMQSQASGSPEIQLTETFTSEAQSAQTALSETMSPQEQAQGQLQEQMRSQVQSQLLQEQGQPQGQVQTQAQSQTLQEQMQPQTQGSPEIQLTETFTSEAQSTQTAFSEAMSPQGQTQGQLQEQMRSQVQTPMSQGQQQIQSQTQTQMSQEQGQAQEQMSSQVQSQTLQEQMQLQGQPQSQMQPQGQQQGQPQETRKLQQSRPQANGAKNFNGTANSRKCISELTLRLMENRAKLPDFENHEIYDCVRIEPNDIGLLEMENWRLGVNSFLTHGYYNYKYLMLGKLRFQDGVVKAVLGVPGVFNNKEQYIAKIFGFDLFVPVKHTNIRTGNFGYWIVELV